MITPSKKHLILAAAGAALQTVGNLCILLAVAGISKEIHTQVKRALIRELSRDIPG